MRSAFRNALRVLVLAGLFAGVTGCASTKGGAATADKLETTLMVARAGEKVSLSWDSKPGYIYNVVWSPKLGAGGKWQPLPQYQNLRGTGQALTAEDMAPGGQTRYYRLHIVPAN